MIQRFIVLLFGIGSIASAEIGPYADDYEGIPHTEAVFEGWINHVVQTTQTNLFSGGYSHDDLGSNATAQVAVSGKPFNADLLAQ